MRSRGQMKRKSPLRLPRKVKAELADLQRRLLERFPNDISHLILYGSWARGEATADSDQKRRVVMELCYGRACRPE